MPDATGTGPRWRSTGSDDAIVVGAGPNGLVAAITLAGAGWNVTVLEAAHRPGGGTRSEELTLPGVIHDVCSAIHPLGLASPALRSLPLGEHGLAWVQPDVPLAHPLDGGRVALLHRSVEDTAAALGPDASAYRKLFDPFVRSGFGLTDGLLSPLSVPPEHPITLARFGVDAIQSRAASRPPQVRDRRGGWPLRWPRGALGAPAGVPRHGRVRPPAGRAGPHGGMAHGGGRLPVDRDRAGGGARGRSAGRCSATLG